MASPSFTFSSPRQQLFAFPPNVISSILENPSSHKGLMKLYQTCKYFYSKRPILIVDLVWFETSLYDDRYPINTSIKIKEMFHFVSHLKTPIWFTNRVSISDYANRSGWLFKFYRYSIKKLRLFATFLLYDDFVLLTSESMLEWFIISMSYILHSDGTNATIADILQRLPNLKQFEGEIDKTCSSEVLTQLNKIEFNNKISFSLEISNIHPSFDLNLFCQFFVKNSNPHFRNGIRVYNRALEKLKPMFETMDPKWKKEENYGLQELFFQIEK